MILEYNPSISIRTFQFHDYSQDRPMKSNHLHPLLRATGASFSKLPVQNKSNVKNVQLSTLSEIKKVTIP